MSDMIRSFDELTEQQVSAGGKGGTLARLYQAGYPVPDGFVVLPTAFAGDKLTTEGWIQVQAHLARMRKADQGIAFAVRSSAMSEDAAQASFAGEFETVLDVHTDEMIQEAIHTVRRSRHSERVRAYSKAKGMDAAHEIAVIVQRLVRADVSGVLFTADPVSGSRACMIGNYIYGLGDELVSGEAEPYTFTLKRPKGQYEGPPDMKRSARRLYKLASRLEKELGCPQDIEWAVVGGKLYLLQSRPITTLVGYDPVTGVWNDSLTGDYLWVDNGGIYPEVMTPSSMSVWRVLLAMQMAGVAAMGFIGGRLYGNYSFLYTLLRKIGRSDEGIRDFMEVRLGPLPEGIDIPTIPISTIGLLGDWLPLAIEMLPQQMRLKKRHQSIVASAPKRCRELRQRIRETNEKAGLIPLWRDEVWPLFWDLLQLLDGTNDDYFNPYVALKRELTKLLGKEDANILLSALGGGGSGELVSVGPLVDMAKVARGEMTREAYIERYGHREANENELAVPRPQEDPRWLDKQLAEFEQSPVDVQKLLEKSAAGFDAVWKKFEVSHPKKAKKLERKIDQFTEALHKREEVRSELTRSVGVMRHWFLRAGELTGLGDDVFFLTYQEVLDILSGDHFDLAQYKDSPTAYITIRRETYEKYSALPPYPMVIRGRFDPIQWASDPNRRTDYFDSFSPTSEAISTLRQAQDTASNTIRGVAGSAGRVEGIVRLLNSPNEGDQLRKGEILLATTTNIGWTPLFTRAAAVITDIGAPLSHAAIVARELGIPAVVGCGNATMRLRTGDQVRVDGGQGTVEILRAA